MKQFSFYAIVSTILSGLLIWPLFLCKNLLDGFYFNQAIYAFHLQLFFDTDKGLPHIIARAFHNKLTIFFPDVINAYLHYWDLLFIISFLGILGAFGFFYSLWSFFTKPTKKSVYLSFVSILVPLFISLFYSLLPYLVVIGILWLSWEATSLVGLYLLVKRKPKNLKLSLFIALILTIAWIVVFNKNILLYCIK